MKNSLQETDTYPTKREVRKIIDSKGYQLDREMDEDAGDPIHRLGPHVLFR